MTNNMNNTELEEEIMKEENAAGEQEHYQRIYELLDDFGLGMFIKDYMMWKKASNDPTLNASQPTPPPLEVVSVSVNSSGSMLTALPTTPDYVGGKAFVPEVKIFELAEKYIDMTDYYDIIIQSYQDACLQVIERLTKDKEKLRDEIARLQAENKSYSETLNAYGDSNEIRQQKDCNRQRDLKTIRIKGYAYSLRKRK